MIRTSYLHWQKRSGRGRERKKASTYQIKVIDMVLICSLLWLFLLAALLLPKDLAVALII
jgi:hypothetical protein